MGIEPETSRRTMSCWQWTEAEASREGPARVRVNGSEPEFQRESEGPRLESKAREGQR